jgi:apolipoprotein N-acyltransferase
MTGVYGAVFFILIAQAALAMVAAERKGRNEWVVGIFAFFTGTGLLLALYFAVFARKYERPGSGNHTSDARPASSERVQQLERLAKLRDAGSLTDDEFAAEKARLFQG